MAASRSPDIDSISRKVVAIEDLPAEFEQDSDRDDPCVVFPIGARAEIDPRMDRFGTVWFASIPEALAWVASEAARLRSEKLTFSERGMLTVLRFPGGKVAIDGINGHHWDMCPRGAFGYHERLA